MLACFLSGGCSEESTPRNRKTTESPSTTAVGDSGGTSFEDPGFGDSGGFPDQGFPDSGGFDSGGFGDSGLGEDDGLSLRIKPDSRYEGLLDALDSRDQPTVTAPTNSFGIPERPFGIPERPRASG